MSDALGILSLCSGYGGLDLGVAAAFANRSVETEVVAYSEVDPHAAAVFDAHHPGVPNLGDLKTIDPATLPAFSIMTAGYPCQPFSLSGRRKGTDDDRHLWPHLLELIRHTRPRYVFMENVPGHRSKGFDVVVAGMASVGYRVAWTSLRASDPRVGAPHRRERLFWGAVPDTAGV